MSGARLGLYLAFGVANLAFLIGLWRSIKTRRTQVERATTGDVSIGFVTMFLDALGIGCYAPTTACFKFRRAPRDELIPGTLNIGHNLASSIEAAVMITAVAVAPSLLVGMIGSATLGAWLGAGRVSRLSRASIQASMGAALLLAALFFALANLGALPAGGTAMGLEGWRYGVAVGASFVCGALMTVGIGTYAPMMAMLGLLGMHPLGAFPIMMGSCALLQPVACLRFFQSGRFAFGASLGLTVGGVVGVLIALFIVKSLPLHLLRWLVVIVVSYAAFSMLRSWKREGKAGIVDLDTGMSGPAPGSTEG